MGILLDLFLKLLLIVGILFLLVIVYSIVITPFEERKKAKQRIKTANDFLDILKQFEEKAEKENETKLNKKPTKKAVKINKKDTK